MAIVKVNVNTANVLTLLGSVYRNAADALKEYISNALDEWQKAYQRGDVQERCKVVYKLEREKITIDYNAPGMDEEEFKAALRRVADSAKKRETVAQIGRLGIGIWAFNQIGSSATFYSKKGKGYPTLKVTLRRDSDNAEIEEAIKRESRRDPGMTVVIRGLLHDPLKPRSAVAPDRLQAAFADKFDSYLRAGRLIVEIQKNGKVYPVEPAAIDLPTVGADYRELPLRKDNRLKIKLQLWFDKTGKSKVSIRHTGVVVVDDLKSISALGLEESIYASGYVKGYIDADFLKPLPARTGFEENELWVEFLSELDTTRPCIEDEVKKQKIEAEQERLTHIREEALRLAQDILSEKEFRDLELLGGMVRSRSRSKVSKGTRKGKRTGTKSKKSGDKPMLPGFRINFSELPFEEGPQKHSRFISGTVQVNTLNPDYRTEIVVAGIEEPKLAYLTMLIGKETVSFNDKTKSSDDFLEKLLSFHFRVKRRVSKKVINPASSLP